MSWQRKKVSTAQPSDDLKHNFKERFIVLLRCFLKTKNKIEISLFSWRRFATKDLCQDAVFPQDMSKEKEFKWHLKKKKPELSWVSLQHLNCLLWMETVFVWDA
uniref:Uncharacterized protein n=1 Tax=Micrurus lemniscatus lemniscatus TaxID=129467 RepID=A0A2D4ISC4_MICLE